MEIAHFCKSARHSLNNLRFYIFIFRFRVHSKKRSLSSSHSSHSILTQPSVASEAGDEVEGSASTHHAKVAERRSNGSTDFHGMQLILSHSLCTFVQVTLPDKVTLFSSIPICYVVF